MNIGFLGLLQPGGLTQLSKYLKSREMHEVQWYLVFRMFFISSTRYQDALILISGVGKMAITPDFDFLSLVFSDIAEFENAANTLKANIYTVHVIQCHKNFIFSLWINHEFKQKLHLVKLGWFFPKHTR